MTGARRRLAALVVLCTGLDVLEWALVSASGPDRHATLAPQASAVVPFGVFHDLRWISVGHDSWSSLALELGAMLVVRSALTALSVALAWPVTHRPPAPRSLALRAALATGVSSVLLVPCAALVFGIGVVPVSWIFLAAVPTVVLVALVVHPMAVDGRWWRNGIPLRALAWVIASFAILSGEGALAAVAGRWPALAVTAGSGVANAVAWNGLVGALVRRVPTRRPVPVVPVSLGMLCAVVVVGVTVGFERAREAPTLPAASAASRAGMPVLVVSGYGSRYEGKTTALLPGAFTETQFSYRGLDAEGRPLPYSGADTVKPLAQLDRMMAAQVAALAARSHRRIDVVAESEGALVAKTALLARPGLPVDALVMASPLLAPGRASYPSGTRSGWSMGTRELMVLIGRMLEPAAPIDLSPGSAFIGSLNEQAGTLGPAMSCPVPGVRQFALLPLADATVTPVGAPSGIPSVVVSAFHGGLIADRADDALVARLLMGRSVSDGVVLRGAELVIRSMAAAWQVPERPGQAAPSTCAESAAALARAAVSS